METEKSKQKQTSKRERIKKAKSSSNGTETHEIHSAKPLTLSVRTSLIVYCSKIHNKFLIFQTIVPEMILMGIIKSTYSTHLYVSLPGRLVGKVPITNISKAYSTFLQTVLETQDLTSVRIFCRQNQFDN